jgi:multiple sugar transport system permease protein
MTKLAGRLLTWVLIIFWLTFALGPYIWMFLTSVKPKSEIYSLPFHYLPKHWTFASYHALFTTTPFLQYVFHSLIVAAFTALCTLLLAIPAGFSFSRHRFRGKGIALALLISSQFFPSILLILGIFPLMKEFGLINHFSGLILIYTAFVTPFTIWLIKGFFDGIPKEIDEAAMIDGCNQFQVIRHVLLPLLSSGIVAASAYIVIFSWNEFLFALTFASNSNVMTIPVGLDNFIGNFDINWGILTAGGCGFGNSNLNFLFHRSTPSD